METLHSHDANARHPSKAERIVFSSRYELMRRLGEGGTSSLFIAKDRLCSNSSVVLKCIHSSLLLGDATRDIAKCEFVIAKQLSHPNLVNIYDVRRDKGIEYLVMEHLSGDSLKNILSRSRFSYNKVIQLMEPLVSVLDYLHSQGVVHSDVKPSNIVITDDNRVKLIDLANCRQDKSIESPAAIISTEHFFGYSLDYSSPQVMSDQPASANDDVFSLACIVYEMLEGKSPIPSEKKSAEFSLGSVKKPNAINGLQWKVLKRAMSIDSKLRHNSVEDFFNQFKRARRLPAKVFTSTVTILLLACLGVLTFDKWQQFSRDHVAYKGVYEEQELLQRHVLSISSREPGDRYQHLGELSVLPETLRVNALLSLHDDVVLPITKDIQDGLILNRSSSGFTYLYGVLDILADYYPSSKHVFLAQKTIDEEKSSFVSRLLVSLQDTVASGVYDKNTAKKINTLFGQLVLLDGHGSKNIEEKIDVNPYKTLLIESVESQDFLKILRLRQFALDTQSHLSVFNASWSSVNSGDLEYMLQIANYLDGVDHTLEDFPVDAALFFFGDELINLQKFIKPAFYNKDFKRYSDQLLALKSKYLIPSDFTLFEKTKDLLLAQMNKKIGLLKSQGKRKSAAWLEREASKLTQ